MEGRTILTVCLLIGLMPEPGAGGGYYYNVQYLKVQVTIACEPYTWSEDDNYPTCASKLSHNSPQVIKDDYRVSTGLDYLDVVYTTKSSFREDSQPFENPGLEPNPRQWDATLDGNHACPVWDRYCRKLVKCKMVQDYRAVPLVNPGDTQDQNAYSSAPGTYLSTDTDAWAYSYRIRKMEADPCILCALTACDKYECEQGQVVLSPPKAYFDSHLVFRLPDCREATCAAGTWLTCEKGSTCKYHVPTTYHTEGGEEGKKAWFRLNTYAKPSDLNVVEAWPLPVGSCYPCVYSQGQQHYGVKTDTPLELFRAGFLSYKCEGGSLAPALCPPNMVTKIDQATGKSGACECMNGYYWNAAAGGCKICPAGYRCRWVGMTPPVKEECPLDYYALEGKAECTKCRTGYQMCEKTQALSRCVPGDEGVYQRGDAECIPCEQCKQVTAAKGAWPCYRVTQAFTQDGAVA
jgi:hypothetical protein